MSRNNPNEQALQAPPNPVQELPNILSGQPISLGNEEVIEQLGQLLMDIMVLKKENRLLKEALMAHKSSVNLAS